MPKKVTKKNHRRSPDATSIHEAAHFVAGLLLCPLNYQVEISILRDRHMGTLGRVIGEDLEGHTAPRRRDMENEIIVLYAGYTAEVLICRQKAALARVGARSDFEKAETILEVFGVTGVRRRRLESALRMRAKMLVRKYRVAIEALAKELRRVKVIPGDEAALIVAVARGDKKAQASLDNLRTLKILG